jgi:hypothetical protein
MHKPRTITCVDFDAQVPNRFPIELKGKLGSQLKCITSDFLTWAKHQVLRKTRFDCIVVNPPFCGRKYVTVSHFGTNGHGRTLRKAPLELAFLVKCIELLSDSGRLLAVLPSSAITSSSTRWFREFLLQSGSVTYVHEIPPNTFRGVEGRIFLLVFDKNRRRESVTLCNSDLFRPQKLHLWMRGIRVDLRLDYSFYKATRKQKPAAVSAISHRTLRIKWAALSEIATILRGKIEAPFKISVLHTTDRNGPFWLSKSGMTFCNSTHVAANVNDILVSRVGRKCANSIGLYCGKNRVTVSDCVLIIRPNLSHTAIRLLFGIRVLLRRASTAALLERGTGASYITLAALSSLQVPLNLHELFAPEFNRYVNAIRRRLDARMEDIEVAVAKKIGLSEG